MAQQDRAFERVYTEDERKRILKVINSKAEQLTIKDFTQEVAQEKKEPEPGHDAIYTRKGMKWSDIHLEIDIEKEKETFRGTKYMQQPVRKAILWLLCMYPDQFYISEIAAICKITEACAQFHVTTLQQAGLLKKVRYEKYGHCVYPILINRQDVMDVLQFQEQQAKQ